MAAASRVGPQSGSDMLSKRRTSLFACILLLSLWPVQRTPADEPTSTVTTLTSVPMPGNTLLCTPCRAPDHAWSIIQLGTFAQAFPRRTLASLRAARLSLWLRAEVTDTRG